MLLSDKQIELINNQFGIHPLPDSYPGLVEIKNICGDHTFYLTADGLHLWEYAETPNEEDLTANAVAVKVASWANEEKTDLAMHRPQLTEVTLELKLPAPAPAQSVK